VISLPGGEGEIKEYKVIIKEIKPIFTGDANKDPTDPPRETGVIGSIRWWYEALIRSLGGSACDPTKTKCNQEAHCVVCELFGCTGWSRKFRLIIERKKENKLIFRFIELRPMEEAEWILLNSILRIIAGYGIIGGKMTERENYGLIEIDSNEMSDFKYDKSKIEKYIEHTKRNMGKRHPDLNNFIFIDDSTFKEDIENIKNVCDFLKGSEYRSKRYFYKEDNNKIKHFFAYAEDEFEWEQLKNYFKKKNIEFLVIKEILEELSI
jgi:CRISPR-associated protein Cmr1